MRIYIVVSNVVVGHLCSALLYLGLLSFVLLGLVLLGFALPGLALLSFGELCLALLGPASLSLSSFSVVSPRVCLHIGFDVSLRTIEEYRDIVIVVNFQGRHLC
jgi:hypothetical protein